MAMGGGEGGDRGSGGGVRAAGVGDRAATLDKDKIRLLGFTRYTTSTFRSSAMLYYLIYLIYLILSC